MIRPRLEPRARTASLLVLLGLLSGTPAGCGGGSEEPSARPNVLLISLDTLRADHLGAYGYGRDTSPRIDALAASGTLFEDAVSTTSWTLPSHLSMLTGLAISAHGVCDDRLWQVAGTEGAPDEVPLRGTFLPELLQASGYRTAGFYTWKYLEPRFGFGPGFETYERVGHSVFSHPEWSKRFEALRAAGKIDEIQRWRDENPALFDEQRPTAGEAVDRALAWLDGTAGGDAEEPFFLFVHLFDIHDGYVPPPPFDARFTDPDYRGPITGRKVTTPDSPVRPDMASADLAQLIALYDGEIAWVDSQVGRLLDRLDALGLREDTLVVLTSDHGEEFFEHGAKTHRAQLHRESVHVPLIVSWPGRVAADQRIAGPAGIVDILPTVCGLAGVAAPPTLSGRDLSEVARGEADHVPADYTTQLVVFPPGASAPDRHVGLWFEDRHALTVRSPGGALSIELFDLARDPTGAGRGESVPAGSEAARSLGQRLELSRARLEAARSGAPPRGGASTPLSPEEIAELQKMGYTGIESGTPGATRSDRLCIDGCVWPD
ncbi:MAG: sulfatase [Planctomycetota bacterium]